MAVRLWHFVERYKSLDTMLAASGITTVIELAAGLSLRSLALAQRQAVRYLDTDLPEMIETKRKLVERLAVGPLVGDVTLRAMNALADGELATAVDELPAGPVALLNEGLLMYLDDAEKRRLAASVREVLARRGGVSITADIYLKTPPEMPQIDQAIGYAVFSQRIGSRTTSSRASRRPSSCSPGQGSRSRVARARRRSGRRGCWSPRRAFDCPVALPDAGREVRTIAYSARFASAPMLRGDEAPCCSRGLGSHLDSERSRGRRDLAAVRRCRVRSHDIAGLRQ